MMVNKAYPAQSFLIIGLGQTGLSCARFLTAQGHAVAMLDTRENPPGLEAVQQEMPEILVQTGGLIADWMLKSDTIILSPGVDPRLPEIKSAREQGIEIIGDIELFTRYVNAPVIAITGSNGKSTVTTMLAEMAVTAGKQVQVGGNLGMPALTLITEPAPDFYILELSSFQLETVSSLDAYAAVVLNISPDHLDRYDSEQQYQEAKARIYLGSGTMVINRDDELVNSWANANRHQIGFTLGVPADNEFGLMETEQGQMLAHGQRPLMSVSELQLAGEHNLANALAALALGQAMKLPLSDMLEAVSQYRGLPHRCQLVLNQDDVRWFNDSKATNVGAAIAAIEGLVEDKNIVLIAGGVGKDQGFEALTPVLAEHVKAVVLIGQDADAIAVCVPEHTEKLAAASMQQAVLKAQQVAQQGDIVLLSPACASFDMYGSYGERGEDFINHVEALRHG